MSASRRLHCRLVVGAVFVATLVVGCEDGSNLPEPTRSPSAPSRTAEAPTASRTVALPTPTRTAGQPSSPDATQGSEAPEPSQSATETASAGPTAGPTRTPRQTATATATVTSQPTTEPTTADSPTPSSTATPTSAPASSASSESSGLPGWLWLLILALAAGALAWFFLASSRRRRWDAAFAIALDEARWVIDVLVPSLLDSSVPPDELTQRWLGNQPRLDDLQAELTRLTGDASGSQRSTRIARVSAEVAALRAALASHVAVRSAAGAAPEAGVEVLESRQAAQARCDTLRAAVEDRANPTDQTSTGGSSGGDHVA